MTHFVTWDYLARSREVFLQASASERGWWLEVWTETRDRLRDDEQWWLKRDEKVRAEYARLADLWDRMLAWADEQSAAAQPSLFGVSA